MTKLTIKEKFEHLKMQMLDLNAVVTKEERLKLILQAFSLAQAANELGSAGKELAAEIDSFWRGLRSDSPSDSPSNLLSEKVFERLKKQHPSDSGMLSSSSGRKW